MKLSFAHWRSKVEHGNERKDAMRKIMLRFSFFNIRILLMTSLMIFGAVDFLYSQESDGDDEQEQPWNVSSEAYYYSRYTSYGIDLSQDRSAFSLESEVSHQSGLSAGFGVFALNGTGGGYEHSSFNIGYEYPLSASVTLHGAYTYHSYKTDTLNVLAGISNQLSFGGTVKTGSVLLLFSYNAFIKTGTANYFTVGASTNDTIGELTVEPSVQLSFASQTVSDNLLPKNRGRGRGNMKGTTLTTTITGLSNFTIGMAFRYPLGKGFVTSVVPSYVYSPTDLAASTSQFILNIGLEHSVDF